jgi:hypothetical protein
MVPPHLQPDIGPLINIYNVKLYREVNIKHRFVAIINDFVLALQFKSHLDKPCPLFKNGYFSFFDLNLAIVRKLSSELLELLVFEEI